MTLEEQMAADAAENESAPMPNNEALQQVAEMADRMVALEQYMQKCEDNLAIAKQRWIAIADKELPNKLMELGMSSYTLTNGAKVSYKLEAYCSLKEENKPAAFAWLRQHNLDGVIKNEVSVAFAKGEDSKATEFAQHIAELGMRPEQKQGVHPMTLKALLKEQMEKGVDVPLDTFGAYIVNRAKVELPKSKGKK